MTIRFSKNKKNPATWKAGNGLTLYRNEIKDSNNAEVTKVILSVELYALNENIVCIKCKKCVEQLDKELVICNSCNTMTSEGNCKKSGHVLFTASVNGSNMQSTLIAIIFKEKLLERFKLAKR